MLSMISQEIRYESKLPIIPIFMNKFINTVANALNVFEKINILKLETKTTNP